MTTVPFFCPRRTDTVAPISEARRFMILNPMPDFFGIFGMPIPLSRILRINPLGELRRLIVTWSASPCLRALLMAS